MTSTTNQFYPQGPFGTTFWGGYWSPEAPIVPFDVLGAAYLDAEPLGYGTLRLTWSNFRLADRSGFDGQTVPNDVNALYKSATANFTEADVNKRIAGYYLRPGTFVASVIDSQTILLSQPVNGFDVGLDWYLSNIYDRYLLVRNQYGYPDTPSDGIVVLLGYMNDNVHEFIDGDLSPGYYYYTLFVGLHSEEAVTYGP